MNAAHPIRPPPRESSLRTPRPGGQAARGRDTIEPLLKYCELQGYRTVSHDDYGWARIGQVMGDFFGGSTPLGIGPYTTDRQMDPGDNGIYVIDGWRIAEHLRTEYDEGWNAVGMRAFEPAEEHDWHEFGQMLRSLDAVMPEELRLGGVLDSVEVPLSDVRLGDEVWLYDGVYGKWESSPVVGFGQPSGNRIAVEIDAPNGRKKVVYPDPPYAAHYDHDGDFSWNCSNYVHGDTARIKPRGQQVAAYQLASPSAFGSAGLPPAGSRVVPLLLQHFIADELNGQKVTQRLLIRQDRIPRLLAGGSLDGERVGRRVESSDIVRQIHEKPGGVSQLVEEAALNEQTRSICHHSDDLAFAFDEAFQAHIGLYNARQKRPKPSEVPV